MSKVKERIRDTVLQTTCEWPAVVQERRQRAAMEFEMRAARLLAADEHRPSAETTVDKPGSRRSPTAAADDGGPGAERREAARAAFRRHRSVSCEDSGSSTVDGKLHPESASAAAGITGSKEQRESSSNSDISGIVCSSKDLQSIIALSRQASLASPVSVRNVQSVDVADATFQKSRDESSADKRRRLTADRTGAGPTVNVHVECSTVASATSTKPLSGDDDDDRDLATPLSGSESDCVPMTSSNEPEVAAAAAAATKPPSEAVYDADGRTWDVYGADMDPEVLGNAIQRHLQSIMLTTVAVDETLGEDGNDDSGGDLPVTVTAKQSEKSGDDDCPTTERRRNFIQKCLPKRRR